MRVRTTALLLLLMACVGRKDADLDGIVGRRDACPEQPEKRNGYADDDGCPDELARLRVTVRSAAGDPVPGVTLSLPGSKPVLTDAMGNAMWFDLVPVPELMVEAIAPSGARGQATLALPDGPVDVTITLMEPPDPP